MDFTSFGYQKIEVFLLVLARTAGIFTLVPLFGAAQVPVRLRITIAFGIAIVFVPLCMPAGNAPLALDVISMVLMIVKEAFVGLVIGFVTILVFAAIQNAGDLIDMHSGFSFASMIDPINGAQTSVAGRFHHLLAGMLFFAINAHHILISGLADSFRIVPIGQMALNPDLARGVTDLFVALFAVAIRIAAPVVAAVFLADVAMAIIARVVPQMNILMAGLPLKLGVGLIGMLVALPVSIVLTKNALGGIYPDTAGLLRILAGH
jgi:flagellar biosynthetic protein FliR